MLKETWKTIRSNFKQIFVFEFLYRLGWYAIFRFLVRVSLQHSLDKKGYSYLTAENFKVFVRSGWTGAAFVFAALFFLATMLFEVSALFSCFEAGREGRKLTLSEMIHEGAHRVKLLMIKDPILWVLFTVLLLPYLCAYFLFTEALQIKFLNYLCQYLYHLLPGPFSLAAGSILLLIAGFFCLKTLPEALLYEKRLRKSAKESISHIRREEERLLPKILACQVLVMLLVALLYFGGCVSAVVYVRTWERKEVAVGLLLVFCEWLRGVTGFVAGSVGMVINGAFLYILTTRGKEKQPDRVKGMSRIGGWVSKGLVCLFAGICLFFGWKNLNRSLDYPNELDTATMVTAHRGAAWSAPENTMAAMENAVNKLADYVEIDIQETKDGVLVLLHDNNLKRTTGCKKNIWEVDYEELQKLDAGSWFRSSFAGEQVPTLDEVLDYCRDRMIVNIELKSNGHNKNIVEKVLALVEEKGMEEQCVITSMNYAFLQQAKELNPDITTGYIMAMAYGDVERLTYADFLSVKYTYINDQFVTKAHECGKAVHAWTVNSRYDMKRMIMLKVDNLITDRPELAVQILAEEAGQESFVELLRYVIHR